MVLFQRRAAELVEPRRDPFDAAVLLDLVEARQRQQQRLAAGVGDLHHLDAAGGRAGGAVVASRPAARLRRRRRDRQRAQGDELADAVVGVHDVVADLEVAQAAEERRRSDRAAAVAALRRGKSCASPKTTTPAAGRRKPRSISPATSSTPPPPSSAHVVGLQGLAHARVLGCGRHHQQRLAAGARGLHLARKARQLVQEEIGGGGAEVDDPIARGRQLVGAHGGAGDRGEHAIEIEHQLPGRDRERPLLAPGLELGLERLRAVPRLALERLGLDRDHQRLIDALDQQARMARQQRQQVLPSGEGRAVLQPGEALPGFEAELVADQLRQTLAEEARLVVAAREQIER